MSSCRDAMNVRRVLAVNLEGAIHLTRACTRAMLRRRAGGAVLNVSSIVASRGAAGLAVYSASKGGLESFTRALARELGPVDIRVNAIAPGYLETDMTTDLSASQRAQVLRRTPLGRLGTPADVLGVARFLLSPAAQFITGQVLTVDGGLTC